MQFDMRVTLSADKSITPFIQIRGTGVALRSDSANVQADLQLHCPRVSEDPFSQNSLYFPCSFIVQIDSQQKYLIVPFL